MYYRSTIPALMLAVAWIHATGIALADENPKDAAAVRELVTAFETASNKQDAKAFAAVFTVDADFTNILGMTGHGPQSNRGFPPAAV